MLLPGEARNVLKQKNGFAEKVEKQILLEPKTEINNTASAASALASWKRNDVDSIMRHIINRLIQLLLKGRLSHLQAAPNYQRAVFTAA